jgi:hypothetical protein
MSVCYCCGISGCQDPNECECSTGPHTTAREALAEAAAYFNLLRRATTRDEAWRLVCSAMTGHVHSLLLGVLPQAGEHHDVC